MKSARSYQFSLLPGEHSQTTLRIVLTLEGAIVPQGLSFNRKLRFYIWPFRLPRDAEFQMRLVTADNARGGTFSVLASPLEGDTETAMIARYAGKDDVARCIEALDTGQPFRFNLADDEESLIRFMLPNDGTFRSLYAQCHAAVTAAAQPGPEEEAGEDPPSEQEIRENRKAYAVWMVYGEANRIMDASFGVLRL